MTNTTNLESLSTAELVALHNAHSDKPVKKFSDRKTALRRTQEVLAATAPAAPAADEPTTAKASDERVITVLAEVSPRRPGSLSAERWALLRTGMTVGEYVAAVMSSTRYSQSRAKAVRDLLYDVKKGNISIA